MNERHLRYDRANRKLTYRSTLEGKSLFPKSDGLKLSRIARSGAYKEQPVERVSVHFEDPVTAAHNATPLAFLGLESEHPGGRSPSGARFTVRDDFGLD